MKQRRALTITEDVIAREIQRLSEFTRDEGMTTHEIATMAGRQEAWVRKRLLHPLAASGRLVVGHRSGIAIDGRPTLQVVYQIRKEPQRGKARKRK